MDIEESQLLSRLRVPIKRIHRFNLLVNKYFPRLSRFTKEDSCSVCVPAVLIHTKGKGVRETFYDFEIVTIDTGKIGKCWGEMVIRLSKDGSIDHYFPRKFRIDRDRVLKLANNQ